MADNVVTDPDNPDDDWLDNDDPNDVGSVVEASDASESADENMEQNAASTVVTDENDGSTTSSQAQHSYSYEDLRSQIANCTFVLSEMLEKISKLYVNGMLTGDEYSELADFARQNANSSYEIDKNSKQYIEMLLKHVHDSEETIADIKTRLEKLESAAAGGSDGGSVGEDQTAEQYADYVAGKWYYAGDKVHFTDGKNYVCTAPDEAVCVWSPSEYPTYWEEIVNG